MLQKWKSQRGETLVETLASILIAALSVALLFTCVTASVQMHRISRRADEGYYDALSAAETQTGTALPGTAELTGSGGTVDLNIRLYGGEGMYAYSAEGTGP